MRKSFSTWNPDQGAGFRFAGALLVTALTLCGAADAQVLETETARPLGRNHWEFGAAFEFQTSADGRELAVPLSVEYGISDRLDLLVEPVPYASVRPKAGASASGLGDTEITLTYLLSKETSSWPAFAFGSEVKLPTTKDPLLGTGEYDFAEYLIASKRLGNFDVHANLSYTFVGSPAGQSLDNIFGFGLGTIYSPSTSYELFGEVLGTTSTGVSDTGSAASEASGGELVGTIGAGKRLSDSLLWFVAASDDNRHALQIRTGFTFKF